MKANLLKLNLQFFAEQDTPPEGEPVTPTAAEPEKTPTPTKTFTQEELDDILAKRLKREKDKQAEYESQLKRLADLEKAEEERKKAAMSEQERLQAEKDAAEKRAAELEEKSKAAQESANKRIIDTEIRAIARSLNANDPNDVLALINKGDVKVDDDGNVVGAEEAVKALKDSKSWLFKQPIGADAVGGNPGRNTEKASITALEQEYSELQQKAKGDRTLFGKLIEVGNKLMEARQKQ